MTAPGLLVEPCGSGTSPDCHGPVTIASGLRKDIYPTVSRKGWRRWNLQLTCPACFGSPRTR